MTAATMSITDLNEGLCTAQARADELQSQIDAMNEAVMQVAFLAFSGNAEAMQRREELEQLIAAKTEERNSVIVAIVSGVRELTALEEAEKMAEREELMAEVNRLDALRHEAFARVEDATAALAATIKPALDAELLFIIAAGRAGLHVGLTLGERLSPYVRNVLAQAGLDGMGPGTFTPALNQPLARRDV